MNEDSIYTKTWYKYGLKEQQNTSEYLGCFRARWHVPYRNCWSCWLSEYSLFLFWQTISLKTMAAYGKCFIALTNYLLQNLPQKYSPFTQWSQDYSSLVWRHSTGKPVIGWDMLLMYLGRSIFCNIVFEREDFLSAFLVLDFFWAS